MKNKVRVFSLLKLLLEETDGEHWLSTNEIIEKLEAQGIEVFRKTIPHDIEAIREAGFKVETERSSGNKYAVTERMFDNTELKLLVDAVAYSNCIPVKQKEELIKKILKFESKYNRENLTPYKIHSIKTSDKNVLYNANELMYASIKHCKVSFKMLEFVTPNKQDFKHSGEEYIFHPYDFVFNDGKYYVVGYSQKHSKIINIRIDRIAELKVLKEKFKYPDNFEADSVCNVDFNMFSGERKKVRFSVEPSAITNWVDKFGPQENYETYKNNFLIDVETEISPTLFGWICQFEGKIKIISPKETVEKFNKHLKGFK